MSYKIIETRDFGPWTNIHIETDPVLTAGGIVKLLLTKGIDPEVSWEDNGDVGMKMGGSSKGSTFCYPEMLFPWGGCFYEIEFIYREAKIQFSTHDNEDNEPGRIVTASYRCGECDPTTILTLLGE